MKNLSLNENGLNKALMQDLEPSAIEKEMIKTSIVYKTVFSGKSNFVKRVYINHDDLFDKPNGKLAKCRFTIHLFGTRYTAEVIIVDQTGNFIATGSWLHRNRCTETSNEIFESIRYLHSIEQVCARFSIENVSEVVDKLTLTLN